MIRQISDKLVKNEARRKGLTGESSLYLLARKQPALLVVPDVDRLPDVIAFNTLEPLRGDRAARTELVVRRLGFIFAAVKEGETPGLVGISQVFIHSLSNSGKENTPAKASSRYTKEKTHKTVNSTVMILSETDYEEIIETQIEFDANANPNSMSQDDEEESQDQSAVCQFLPSLDCYALDDDYEMSYNDKGYNRQASSRNIIFFNAFPFN